MNAQYVSASNAGGKNFVLLDKPIRMYFLTEEGKEKYPQYADLKVAYLVDETKNAWDMTQDIEGNEIYNLVAFGLEGNTTKVKFSNNDEPVEVTPINYNFFNWPKKVVIKNENGEVKEQRDKLLKLKYQAPVKFLDPVNKDGQEVIYAKFSMPQMLASKLIPDMIESIKEATGNAKAKDTDFQISYQYNADAPAAEMYSKVKVKPHGLELNLEEELENFKYQEAEAFEPPATPF